MADCFTIQVVTSLLTGSTSEYSKDATSDDTLTEDFRSTVTVAAGAADDSLTLGGMTNPKALVVYGEQGITFKLGAAGADAVGADPIAVVIDEGGGLNIAAILISNADAVDHQVLVIAME